MESGTPCPTGAADLKAHASAAGPCVSANAAGRCQAAGSFQDWAALVQAIFGGSLGVFGGARGSILDPGLHLEALGGLFGGFLGSLGVNFGTQGSILRPLGHHFRPPNR